MSFNHGAVWWSELMTRDVDAAMTYYRDICGWTFETMPIESGGDYRIAVAHGERVAGITDITRIPEFKDAPAHWFTYFAVDNVEAAIERTRFAGGAVIRAPVDIPGIGRVGIVEDPTGATLGLMTPVFPSDALVEADQADEEEPEEDGNFPV